MGDTLTYTGTLDIIKCGSCQVRFAMPHELNEKARQDGSWFWCPKGCKIHYLESENTRLKSELDQAQADARWQRQRAQQAQNLADAERRSAIAYKGHLTRIRKRIANGVCPVPGCKRSGFEKVMAHISTCHEEWLAEHPEVTNS